MKKTEYDDIKATLIKHSLERNKTDVYVPVERRKKEDARINFINIMGLFLCGILLIVITLVIKAGGSFSYILDNKLLMAPVKYWKIELLRVAFLITLISIFTCTICLILNFTRCKRRTDKIKKVLVFCEICYSIIFVFLALKIY